MRNQPSSLILSMHYILSNPTTFTTLCTRAEQEKDRQVCVAQGFSRPMYDTFFIYLQLKVEKPFQFLMEQSKWTNKLISRATYLGEIQRLPIQISYQPSLPFVLQKQGSSLDRR